MTRMTPLRSAATALTCGVAALALLAPVAAGAGTEYVLVNANADGDTPVAGGMARVHRCDRDARIAPVGRPLRQRDGSLGERTYRTGVTMLEFRRLPRCFVVSVTGGRADGRALDGSFVGEGRNGPARIENVPVTPISTLVQALPGMSERRAFRRVQRRLDIPRYYDEFDLQSDDRVFDGDRYLAAVRRAGGVGRLTRELLADRTPPSFHERGAGRKAGAAQAGAAAEWWKSVDVTSAAISALKDFGASFFWEKVVGGGSKWVLGRFLDAYGLREVKDFLFPKSDTEKLLEMVQRLNVRINALEATGNKILREIAVLKTQVAASPAVQLLTHIDTNQNSLQGLAKLDPNKPGLKGGTRALLSAIAVDLPNRNLLHSIVAGRGVPGLLVQDSQRAAAGQFFTPADSQQTRDVYDYYVLYQLRFANLLTEYWNTQSCSQPPGSNPDPETCLAPETIKSMLDEFQTNIQAQQKLLKPAVPANHFVDIKKNLMWVSNPPWVSGAAYRPKEEICGGSGPGLRCITVSRDWRDPGIDLAGESELRGLIDSVPGGENPFEFLVANAGLVSSAGAGIERNHIGDMWLGTGGNVPDRFGAADDFKPVNRIWCFTVCHQRIERVQLQSDDRPGPHVFYHRLGHLDPENHFAHAMPRPQPVAPGTYWYR
jgi:hypothetical protein